MSSIEELIECGHILYEKQLVWGRSGNISIRTDQNTFLVTAGGSDLGSLHSEDIIRCDIYRNTLSSLKKPSMEAGLHRSIYHVNARVSAIIHSQPFYTTLVACADFEMRTDLLPEAIAYLGTIERVPSYHAGSDELAEATSSKAASSYVLVLQNHGLVCCGSTLDEAVLKTETMEFYCRLLVLSRAAGIDLHYLGNETIESFIQHLRYIGRY